MAKQSDVLKTLRIASPCHIDWDHMTGDERVRFCNSCNLHVYNFSELTSNEITELITKTEGRICGRMYRRSDGTIITRDCPVGLKAFRKKVTRVAAAVFATLLSSCSFLFAQVPKKDKSCKETAALTLERKKPANDEVPAVMGKVLDLQGASLPGAIVTLLDSSGQKVREATTTENGEFSMVAVSDGTYSVEVNAIGFQKLSVPQVDLRSNEIASARFVLNFEATVTMGLMAVPLPIEKNNGTTVIPGDVIRKLPIN